MIFGAILAGGKGTRMNISDIPKQFMMLGNKPIIIHTLEKILLSDKLDIIYLGIHEDWISYMEDIIKKYLDIKVNKEINIVAGGKDRNGTIMNIIKDIEEKYSISDSDIILTHDAVRPFISSQIIIDNIEAMEEYDACDTVVPAIDTIVVSEDGKTLSDIPNRNACKIFYIKGEKVYMVKGDISNLKITTPVDYKIANSMLGGKNFD